MSNRLQLQVLLKAVDQATRPLKSIQQASKKLASDINVTQGTLKSLDAQARRIEGFRKTNGQLAVTGEALKKAKAEAAALAVQFRATANPTAQQARLLAASKRAASELQTKYNGLRQSVQRQREALNADGIATRNLSAEQRRLKASVTEASASLARQRQELERLSQKQSAVNRVNARYQSGKALAGSVRNASAAGVGVATAGLYAESRFIAPGVEFDRQMSDTQATLGLAKNDQQLAAIRQQARDIGATTAFSPTDVARTQSVLAKSGFDGNAILKSTESTVNLALASDLDIADAADIITNMQSAFNLPIDEVQRVADVMTKGFTSSNSNLMDFGEAMKYVAPIAEAAGASIEDTTAMLGVLADNGIKGSMAGTATSAMFTRLQSPVGQAGDALSELGVKTQDDKGNMLPIAGILQKIDTSFKKHKLGTAQQAEYLKVIFGEEAMKGAIKLIGAAGNGKLATKHDTVSRSKGATAQIAKVKVDNLDGDLKNLFSAWEDVRIEVFDGQNSALRQLTTTATNWLATAGTWVRANPELVGTLVKVTAGVTALIGGLAALGLIAWPVMAGVNMLVAGAGLLGTVFTVVGGAVAAAFAAITWPVLALIAAVAAGALLIRKYWEPISAFVGGVAEGFKAAMAPVAAAFSPLKPIFDWFGEKIKAVYDWFMALLALVKSTQAELQSAAEMGRKFGSAIAGALNLPMQVLEKLGSKVGWLAKKLGLMKDETAELDKQTVINPPTANGADGFGYSPSGGLLAANPVPVVKTAPPVGAPGVLPAPAVNVASNTALPPPVVQVSPAAIALSPEVEAPDQPTTSVMAPEQPAPSVNVQAAKPLAPQHYAPVVPGASSAYTDNSVTHNRFDIVVPPGMSQEDVIRLLNEAQARQERERRARARSAMTS